MTHVSEENNCRAGWQGTEVGRGMAAWCQRVSFSIGEDKAASVSRTGALSPPDTSLRGKTTGLGIRTICFESHLCLVFSPKLEEIC